MKYKEIKPKQKDHGLSFKSVKESTTSDMDLNDNDLKEENELENFNKLYLNGFKNKFNSFRKENNF